MRNIIRSFFGMAVAGAALAMVRRLSRSRNTQRNVQRLQQKFLGLDDVIKGPKGW